MKVVSLGPLAVGSLLVRGADGAAGLAVVAKATFALASGWSDLSRTQLEVVESGTNSDDDGARVPLDLVPRKANADIVLVGSVHAASGVPASGDLMVRLTVGGFDKRVTLPGRAVGSPLTAFAPSATARGGGVPPSLDEEALDFQAAPPDQQLVELPKPITLRLENLHKAQSLFITTLVAVRPRAFVDAGPSPGTELPLRADTLWIDTDADIATVTWRGLLSLADIDAPGVVVVGTEWPTGGLSWRIVKAAYQAQSRGGETVTVSSHTGPAIGATAMPGSPTQGAAPTWLAPSRPPEAPAAAVEVADEHTAPVDNVRLAGGFRSLPKRAVEVLASPPVQLQAPPVEQRPPPPVIKPLPPPAAQQPPLTVGQMATHARSWSTPPPPVTLAPAAPPSVPAMSAPLEVANISAPVAESAPDTPERVELLWFDDGLPARLRAVARWLGVALRHRPKARVRVEEDAEAPADRHDRGDVLAVLADAEPTGLADLEEAIDGVTTAAGGFTPPLVAVRGRLHLGLDELERLKATVAVATPFAGGPDKRLKETLDAVSDAIKSGALTSTARATQTLRARVVQAFAGSAAALPAGYLDDEVERMLLEQRRFDRRSLLGDTWLRCWIGSGSESVPVYLPEALSTKLPVSAQFRARLIAELHLQQDSYERHPYALRCLGLARALPMKSTVSNASHGPRG